MNKEVKDQPKTISELQEWFEANGFDYYKTRFFIGMDFKEPKAFGIYKDGSGDFVVYKNKANGERAVRYQGPDEKHAVNEIWQRFNQEIVNQKKHWQEKQGRSHNSHSDIYIPKEKDLSKNAKEMRNLFFIIFVTFLAGLIIPITAMDKIPSIIRMPVLIGTAFLAPILASYAYYLHINGKTLQEDMDSGFKPLMKGVLIFLAVIFVINGIGVFAGRKNGYYSKDGELYYRAGSDWYVYNNDKDYWQPEYIVPSELKSSNWSDYKNTGSIEYSYRSFESTSYYNDWKSDDSDSGWTSNDWDSGYTDWNSDW